MTTPKFIQLKANYDDGCEIQEATTRDQVQFFSVYVGEPGVYRWNADFNDAEPALRHALGLAHQFKTSPAPGPQLDRSQFDAVMNPKSKPTVIELTPAEIQSGLDRVRWAEGLILQLPETHDGRNSWLLNYGRDKDKRQREHAKKNNRALPSGPKFCPFCGSTVIAFVGDIDPIGSNVPQDLDEHQCRNESCGRSFWS